MSDQVELLPDLTSPLKEQLFNCADHVDIILKKLQTFYDEKKLCDIALIAGVDNVREHAHRIVLSAASDYFLAMFRSTLEESEAEEVKLENFDGATLKVILNFIYHSKIDIQSDTVESIIMAADFLQLNMLTSACCNFMGKQLDSANCLGLAFFAKQHAYNMLYEKAIRFAYRNFAEVCKETEFFQLNKDQLSKFLFSEDICVNSQELVVSSLVAWIKHDEERQQYALSLFSRVHFNQLDPKFIVKQTESFRNTVEGHQLVKKWLDWHLSPLTRITVATEYISDGKQNQKLAFVSGASDFQIQTFNAKSNEWSYEKWPMPRMKRVEYGIVIVNNKLIVAGGKYNGQITNSVECFDFHTMQWSELPSMALARRWPGMANLNGHLYVIGGESAGNWLQLVEVYNFSTRTWTYSEPLRLCLTSIQVAVIDGKIYAVGNDQRTVECYDPLTVKWTTSAPKTENSINFGIATVDGRIFAVSGDLNGVKCGTVECYNPENNTWTVSKSLGLGRIYVKCASLNDRLIACVGYDDQGEWVNLVEEYKPDENEWRALTPLLPHDYCISSRLFVI